MPAFRVLVTGGNGFLGPFVVAALQRRGAEAVTVARSGGDVRIDLTQAGPRRELLAAIAPSAVLHLAARSRLAECEQDPAAARAVNARLSGELAAEFGNRLLYVSTDLVFDGRAAPYGEHAAPGPLSVYGSSKAEGEELVRAHGGRIVRLPLLFGAGKAGLGASGMLRARLAAQQPVPLFPNEYRTPLHAADAATALAQLLPLFDGPRLVHLPGPERVSRWEFGLRFCRLHGLPAALLQPVECSDPMRPRDVSLAGSWQAPRDLEAMLRDA